MQFLVAKAEKWAWNALLHKTHQQHFGSYEYDSDVCYVDFNSQRPSRGRRKTTAVASALLTHTGPNFGEICVQFM